MKALSLLAVVLTLGLSLGISDAEAAKRLGGGKSFGMQRQMTAPTKAPTAAPTQSPSAASAATAAPATAAAQAPKRSWMGPVAGGVCGLCADIVGCFLKGYAVNPFITLASILWGVLPGQPGVSWEAHLFGAIAGAAAALLVRTHVHAPRLSDVDLD